MVQSKQEIKEKARWTRIKRVYGLTKEQYDALDEGYCPICIRPWGGTVRPCIDHDHVSGEVRGLLCIWCNRRVVGRFRDPMVAYRVFEYLKADRRGWVIPPKKKRKKKKIGRKNTSNHS